MCNDYFDLDFDTPEEIKNEEVKERNLYNKLISDGFILTQKPDYTGSAYIMPDGKFLFLELNKGLLEVSGKVTPGALDFYLIKNHYIKDTDATRVLCQTDNAIRINDGSNFAFEVLIGLPEKKPTYDQFEALESWLDSIYHKNKFYVSVGNEIVSEVFQKYDLRYYLPEDIIKRIKNYYNNGILREAKEIKKLFG